MRPVSALLPFGLSLLLSGCGPEPAPVQRPQTLTVQRKQDHLRPLLLRPAPPVAPALPGTGSARDRSADVRVSQDHTARAQDQPAAALDPARPERLLVVSHSYPVDATAPVGGDAAYYGSFDGGRSFQVSGVVPGLTLGHGGVHQGASDLAAACADDGTCYVAAFVYDLAISRTGVSVSRTGDGGRSWSAPTMVVERDDPGLFIEKSAVAVDNSHGPRRGAVYVVFTRVGLAQDGSVTEAPIYIARSDDRGATFSAPARVSPAELLLNQAARPLVDHHGRVFVVYENYLLDDSLRDQHVLQRSDDGLAFGPPIRAAYVYDTLEALPPALFRTNSYPMVSADPLSGALHLAWADNRYGGPDILLSSSLDGGQSFTDPVRVTDTPPGAQIQHALPAVDCGAWGCGVSFYSSRNHQRNNALLDVYYAAVSAVPARSGRPARSVAGANVRVSEATIDSSMQFGGTFIGDYTALAAGLLAHPAWTGTAVQEPDAGGALVHQQDIFTSALPVRAGVGRGP